MTLRRSGLYRRRDGIERIWLSPDSIETMTEEALRNADAAPTDDVPAVDIERFIRSLGVRMDEHADLDPGVLGQTEFYPGRPPKILISRDLTEAIDDDETPAGLRGRWRATMAHEASHVLMHRVLFEVNEQQESLFHIDEPAAPQRLMRCLKSNVLFRAGGTDWREVQANMGMAALLMPRSVFCRCAAATIERLGLQPQSLRVGTASVAALVAELAAVFEVSRQAAGIRLETLRIVSPTGQRSLG